MKTVILSYFKITVIWFLSWILRSHKSSLHCHMTRQKSFLYFSLSMLTVMLYIFVKNKIHLFCFFWWIESLEQHLWEKSFVILQRTLLINSMHLFWIKEFFFLFTNSHNSNTQTNVSFISCICSQTHVYFSVIINQHKGLKISFTYRN